MSSSKSTVAICWQGSITLYLEESQTALRLYTLLPYAVWDNHCREVLVSSFSQWTEPCPVSQLRYLSWEYCTIWILRLHKMELRRTWVGTLPFVSMEQNVGFYQILCLPDCTSYAQITINYSLFQSKVNFGLHTLNLFNCSLLKNMFIKPLLSTSHC